MNDVTRILAAIEHGEPQAADRLLPLVYDQLRKLAAQRLAQEKPGQTLQATALVHEAYLRLIGPDKSPDWDSRGHFFAAAAEAMRRILVERARRKRSHQISFPTGARTGAERVEVIAELQWRRPGSTYPPHSASPNQHFRAVLWIENERSIESSLISSKN